MSGQQLTTGCDDFPRDQETWRPWTEAEDALPLRLRANGLTSKEISARLNDRTSRAVTVRASRLRQRGDAPVTRPRPITMPDLSAVQMAAIRTSSQQRSLRQRHKPAVIAGGTERPCMCCREPFLSSWIGHRLCDTCRENA